jgi:hypothetical protein
MAGRAWIRRPAQLSWNGPRTFRLPPSQQIAIFPICTPDAHGMQKGLFRQWMASSQGVPSQQQGVGRLLERLSEVVGTARHRLPKAVWRLERRPLKRSSAGASARGLILVLFEPPPLALDLAGADTPAGCRTDGSSVELATDRH